MDEPWTGREKVNKSPLLSDWILWRTRRPKVYGERMRRGIFSCSAEGNPTLVPKQGTEGDIRRADAFWYGSSFLHFYTKRARGWQGACNSFHLLPAELPAAQFPWLCADKCESCTRTPFPTVQGFTGYMLCYRRMLCLPERESNIINKVTFSATAPGLLRSLWWIKSVSEIHTLEMHIKKNKYKQSVKTLRYISCKNYLRSKCF